MSASRRDVKGAAVESDPGRFPRGLIISVPGLAGRRVAPGSIRRPGHYFGTPACILPKPVQQPRPLQSALEDRWGRCAGAVFKTI
jgi:hypothetical protein